MSDQKPQQFENIKQIAEYYKEKNDFKLFSEYCYYQEIGLRKISLEKINKFIDYCKILPFDQQKKICLNLLLLLYNHTNLYTLPTHALTTYLLQFLQDWEKTSEPSATIYQWQGFLTKNEALFTKALDLDPGNQMCLNAIVKINLYQIYYSTHHLNESFFIGDLNEAFQKLDYIQNLIPQIACEKDRQYYIQEFKNDFMLIHAWKEYSSQKLKTDFYNWYNQHPKFQQNLLEKSITVYYKPKNSK